MSIMRPGYRMNPIWTAENVYIYINNDMTVWGERRKGKE